MAKEYIEDSDGNLYFLHKSGYVHKSVTQEKQHKLVIEKNIGRRLCIGEIPHHIDGNKSNNEISHLALLTNKLHADYMGFVIQHYTNQVSFREWLKSRDFGF